jgi:hypothetical protein
MTLHKLWRAVLSFALAFAFLSVNFPNARADEGMWTFNNVPKAEIKKRFGFEVTDDWLQKVQLASVRFNSGGSGSFVSPDGLVLTNHHVAADTLQKISTPEKDYIKTGFYAPTREREVKAPDLELNVLMSIEDVTARVNGAVTPSMSATEANAARRAEIAKIEEESNKATGLRSDVVALYQGGQYNLYRYKKYTDVRLVFAPEFAAAFFGGDPDNFTYPRYDLDMALFHVYENNQPIKTPNYFKWSTKGAKNGELVFVSGHPGSTQRLNTVAHLEYLRDFALPLLIKYLERQDALLKSYSAQSAEDERRAHEDLFGVENSLKALRGQYEGLMDKSLMAKKQARETALRNKVASDARMSKEYGDAWEAIAREKREQPSYEKERRFLESGWGFNSELFNIARELVRLAAENQKPNAERLPEYTDARRASLELALYSPAPIYPDFEKLKLADSLAFMRDELGASNPIVQQVLQGKTPQERAAELVDGTKLADVNVRKQIAAGGQAAIDESNDPMIQLAKLIDPESRAVRKRYEEQVVSVERTNYGKISRALFEIEGTKMYPDATFTLRLSFGAIRGYTENGKRIPPFTTIGGAFQHAAEHGNRPPYQLPASWMENKSKLNLQTPLNFVSTNDIIGGNSGSPVFDRNRQLVGLIFDGNIESLVGNFIYDETQNRSVSVDTRAMFEALRKIYNAKELVDELTR